MECVLCNHAHNDPFNKPWGRISFLQRTSFVSIAIPTFRSDCSPNWLLFKRQRKKYQERESLLLYCNPVVISSTLIVHRRRLLFSHSHLGYDRFCQRLRNKKLTREPFVGDYLPLEKGYFVCPLCKTLSNCLVPVLPGTNAELEGTQP